MKAVADLVADLEAAKIATIAWHVVSPIDAWRHGSALAAIPCPARGIRCSGPPLSLFAVPGNGRTTRYASVTTTKSSPQPVPASQNTLLQGISLCPGA